MARLLLAVLLPLLLLGALGQEDAAFGSLLLEGECFPHCDHANIHSRQAFKCVIRGHAHKGLC
jgi:hypothetical protein